ncbi:GerAB/ArcD/ProY family transporter [Brassicibacter mesophilus]|uniref:GerAB/ArcD/ProY family transporter n=1 Tax=Brassicibacter mesophilus TaxID=745119 RepID=UPI003D261DEC
MGKEVISDRQGIALISLFILGSTSIFAPGLDAKKDIWLAFIIAMAMVLPMILIFARLHFLFPGKDLFDIFQICYGKIIGKIIIILYIWFLFFFASDILVNYGQFVWVASLSDTPISVIIISFAILCFFGLKGRIEVLGRYSELFIFIPIIALFIVSVLLISKSDINNILPVLAEGMKPVFKGAFSIFTFPLAQIVIFTMFFTDFNHIKSPYKVYISGLLIGAIYLFINSLNNVLVLGVDNVVTSYYPTYIAVSAVDIGDLLQRIEVVSAIIFVVGGFIKVCSLSICTCKEVAKLFNLKDYSIIGTPVYLMIMNLSIFQYENIMHYFEFNRQIWPYYHFPFYVIIPITTWIIAEISHKTLSSTTIV